MKTTLGEKNTITTENKIENDKMDQSWVFCFVHDSIIKFWAFCAKKDMLMLCIIIEIQTNFHKKQTK